MARRVQVAIDCESPDRLASFWAGVLNYRIKAPPDGYETWSAYSDAVASEPGEAYSKVVDPEGRGPNVLFHRVSEAKVVKNRVHLDIWVGPEGDKDQRRPYVDAEARRLVELGAVHVRTDEDEVDYYAVMQDPEGNENCIN